MKKSAQGLSLTTVVIGAIVLIVLLVLIGIFSGFFGNKFTPGFKEATESKCEGTGYKKMPGECVPDASTGFNYEQVYSKFAEGALESNEVCCKSSCQALGGTCTGKGGECKPGTALPQGDSGCDVGRACCK